MAEPDALLADRYRLIRQVGSGGMGVVWEAWDERLERPVAVKQLRPQLGLSAEEAELAKSRAMREARITARLHHRNAVPVFDVVEHEGQPCLIMQFLPSVPLSAVLRESGPLGVNEAARIGAQVASALAAAHQLGIVHRDVKPGNILIADDGAALISDFGISHALGDATLTSTGLVHGTPAYLAPEVARGADSGFESDVFSLGGTIYAALEGAPPFGTDSNSIALLYRVASGEFAPPQRAGALTSLLVEMLRPDPAARPSMKEAATRFAAVEAGDRGSTATAPLLADEPTVEAPRETTGTTQVRRRAEPPTVLAAPPAAAASAAAAAPPPSVDATSVDPGETDPPTLVGSAGVRPVVPLPLAGRPATGRRRRAPRVLAAVALLVGLVVLGAALVTGQLGRGGGPTAAAPATGATSRAAAPAPASSSSSSSSSEPGSGSSGKASSSSTSSSEPSDSPSPSATRSTRSPSPSPTSTSASGEPTAAELEDAITTYYGLLPGDTDRAWKLLTEDYQRSPSGGRQGYEGFWDEVDRVSVSKVEATSSSQVEATVTYRRGDSVDVERTSFRLVRDDGILKIAQSSVNRS